MNSHLSSTYIAICLKPPHSRRWRAVLAFYFGCCSRWGLHWPSMSPCQRWALTSPFHPYLFCNRRLFSVALSLRSPSLDVIQHHCSMEPGLSSYASFRTCYTRLFNLLFFYCTFFSCICQISFNFDLSFFVLVYIVF